MTIQEALKHSSTCLAAHATPRLDSECLLQCVLRMRKEQLYAHSEQRLTPAQQAQWQDLLLRRQQGEPIAYLVGKQEFYGRDFAVDRRVLIPRPESEQLIMFAQQLLPAHAQLRILDIGTGSGCLAITLALVFPNSQVTAWEISPDALAVAQHNATQFACHNVVCVQHDIFSPVPTDTKTFDLIVANPPYILPREKSSLPASVLNYEPYTALFTDPHGLAHYQRIAVIAAQLLAPDALLCVELNPATAQETEKIFRTQGLAVTKRNRDLQGLPRTLVLREHCLNHAKTN